MMLLEYINLNPLINVIHGTGMTLGKYATTGYIWGTFVPKLCKNA